MACVCGGSGVSVTDDVAGGGGALKSGPTAHAPSSVVAINAEATRYDFAGDGHAIGYRRDLRRSLLSMLEIEGLFGVIPPLFSRRRPNTEMGVCGLQSGNEYSAAHRLSIVTAHVTQCEYRMVKPRIFAVLDDEKAALAFSSSLVRNRDKNSDERPPAFARAPFSANAPFNRLKT